MNDSPLHSFVNDGRDNCAECGNDWDHPYHVAAPRPHPDDVAVDRFAERMKAKLAKKRAEGRGGWEDKAYCTDAYLSKLLREHVEKGDPVDVANFAMMLHQRGERIRKAR